MKKVVSSFLLFILWPIKWFKKTNFDNFVGGLIVGSIFSLVVNVATVQFQEMLSKQRTLEAIENEIANNMIKAKTTYEANLEDIENKEIINYYYTTNNYSQDFWSQSSDGIKYITQLDPEIQSLIMIHYSHVVKPANKLVEKADDIINEINKYCYTKDSVLIYDRKTDCEGMSFLAHSTENMAAELIYDNSHKLLEKFHPTSDRLKNWFLRLVISDKSTRLLSGETAD